MIELDGSYGEGGGQIVRTAVALSAVTGEAVKISEIRKNRPKPGLAPQHVKAILATGELCNARSSGVEPRSEQIVFEPGEVHSGAYKVDIGTAGSITLLLQCVLPAMLSADGPVSFEVHGGTDVRWSPTIDYFDHVFLPALASFGIRASMELVQRGYYPAGMGIVNLKVEPASMRPISLGAADAPDIIKGISHCSNLPEHVARRQADSASEKLKNAGFEADISQQVLKAPSTGSGITIWSGHKGGSALGERGVKAETVGVKAADEIISELKSDAAVDVHLADQLIPYLALAGGSYTTREISMHARTNIWTASQFLERQINVLEGKVCEIKAE